MEEGFTIRYTEFEKRIIRGSKNLYRGKPSSMHEEPQEPSLKWYELSHLLVGWFIFSSVLSAVLPLESYCMRRNVSQRLAVPLNPLSSRS
ncbi:MAG: hypothetical protein QXI42_10870, partial [Thermoproteota archaeon]